MLLWASKFATAKIECSFEMGKLTILEVTYILLEMVPDLNILLSKLKSLSWCQYVDVGVLLFGTNTLNSVTILPAEVVITDPLKI